MIFDVMSSFPTPGQSEVTVNLAANEVAVTNAGPNLQLINPLGNLWFSAGDNIILTGAFVNVPFGLGQGTGAASITINWIDSIGNATAPAELAGSGILPFVNFCGQEFPPSGLFITCPRGAGKQFLRITNIAANVSMLNVPVGIDGQTLTVQWHLRVNHTKALTAVP